MDDDMVYEQKKKYSACSQHIDIVVITTTTLKLCGCYCHHALVGTSKRK